MVHLAMHRTIVGFKSNRKDIEIYVHSVNLNAFSQLKFAVLISINLAQPSRQRACYDTCRFKIAQSGRRRNEFVPLGAASAAR
mgnify:CR=1 FL=1